MTNEKQYLEEGSKLSDKEGQHLERRIREMQETRNKIGRRVNTKAQTMFEQEEKQVRVKFITDYLEYLLNLLSVQ